VIDVADLPIERVEKVGATRTRTLLIGTEARRYYCPQIDPEWRCGCRCPTLAPSGTDALRDLV